MILSIYALKLSTGQEDKDEEEEEGGRGGGQGQDRTRTRTRRRFSHRQQGLSQESSPPLAALSAGEVYTRLN